jgi:hypothetical protein
MLRRERRGPRPAQILQLQIKILNLQLDAPARREREDHGSFRCIARFKRDGQQREDVALVQASDALLLYVKHMFEMQA